MGEIIKYLTGIEPIPMAPLPQSVIDSLELIEEMEKKLYEISGLPNEYLTGKSKGDSTSVIKNFL